MYFHFVAREDVQDFRLVESLLDVLGYQRALQLQTGRRRPRRTTRWRRTCCMSRQDFAPIYQRILNTSGPGFQRAVSDERQLGRSYLARGVTSDTHEQHFPERPRRARARCSPSGRRAMSRCCTSGARCGARASCRSTVPQGLLYTVRLALRRGRPERPHRREHRHDAAVHRGAAGPGRRVCGGTRDRAGQGGRACSTTASCLPRETASGMCSPWRSSWRHRRSRSRLTLSDLVIGNRNHHLIWRPTPGGHGVPQSTRDIPPERDTRAVL